MASKGRVPPQHLRRPLLGPGVVHPDAYGSAIHQLPGGFRSFEMLPPPEVMEHKLSAQHIEIEKLATENQRLAATHVSLRHDLAAAKQELQLLHAHIADVKSEQEQQTRGIIDKMSTMEAELEGAEAVRRELQQARVEAQKLIAARQEQISKVQQLTRDLQIAHSEVQQIPPLISELDSLRQEYQHCRAAYDYEKKLYNDHLESLQVMEKNFVAMSREVEKLRAELTNSASFDPRMGGPGSGSAGYHGSVALGNYASGQNVYGVVKGQMPVLGGVSGGGAAAGASGPGGNSPHIAVQSALTGSGTGLADASRGSGHTLSEGTGYDRHRGHVRPGFDPQQGQSGASNDNKKVSTGPNYESQRGPNNQAYDPHKGAGGAPVFEAQSGLRPDNQRAPGYDVQRGPIYEMQRSSGNDVKSGCNNELLHKGGGYHPASRGIVGPQGQASTSNTTYVSSTPTTRAGSGYDSVPRGANPNHR